MVKIERPPKEFWEDFSLEDFEEDARYFNEKTGENIKLEILEQMLDDCADCDDYMETYPDNYDELLDAEIKDTAQCNGISESAVRKFVDFFDLTDLFVKSRQYWNKR